MCNNEQTPEKERADLEIVNLKRIQEQHKLAEAFRQEMTSLRVRGASLKLENDSLAKSNKKLLRENIELEDKIDLKKTSKDSNSKLEVLYERVDNIHGALEGIQSDIKDKLHSSSDCKELGMVKTESRVRIAYLTTAIAFTIGLIGFMHKDDFIGYVNRRYENNHNELINQKEGRHD